MVLAGVDLLSRCCCTAFSLTAAFESRDADIGVLATGAIDTPDNSNERY